MTVRLPQLALHGGDPVRRTLLPYGQQSISAEDIAAVVATLRAERLTTGPQVAALEQAFAAAVGAPAAVAVSSGTAALHAAMYACGIGPGDEVLVPTMTFAATANSVVFQGGTPVFVDVDPTTLLIDPAHAAACITPATKALVAVDYAGQPCAYTPLRALARQHGLALIADACHAPGASYRGTPVGALADLTTFSLHPVKHITAGEGGIVTTHDPALAARMRRFRNHCINTDDVQRQQHGTWLYEIDDLGYNYRLTDMQCALAQSQLARLPAWVARRQQLAADYTAAFAHHAALRPLATLPERTHAYHLYVVQLDPQHAAATRADVFAALRAEGIGVNVHYIPVHLHPFYRQRYQTRPGQCPAAEAAYEQILSLPIFPHMTPKDHTDVVTAVDKVLTAFAL